MKRCPKCDFGFVDFHRVCDFDGTDLVDDPHTLPVSPAVSALVAATESPFLRLVKSPVFFTVVALAGVLSSLLLLVYFDAAVHPKSLAENPVARNFDASVDASIRLPTQLPVQSRTRIPATSADEVVVPASRNSHRVTSRFSSTRVRSAAASSSRLPLRSSPALRNPQSRSELALQGQSKDKAQQQESNESALQRDAKEKATRKDSKLSAMLKTTWNVLKRPFK